MLASLDVLKVRKPEGPEPAKDGPWSRVVLGLRPIQACGCAGHRWVLPFLLALLCTVVGALAILSSVRIARADTLCVKPGGGGGCYASVNTAITTANISDTIRVAMGVYTENVLITKTITLEGG